MGLCDSRALAGSGSASAGGREIDQQLIQSYLEEAKVVKLLLLGTGEAGKTTVLKQVRLLNNDGFSQLELSQQRCVVYSNTVLSMVAMLRAMRALCIGFENAENEVEAAVVDALDKEGEASEPFAPATVRALRRLWADGGVRRAFDCRAQYQLNDSAQYFLDALDRTSDSAYRPTAQDVLRTRVKTTGISEMQFTAKNALFRIIDVGGQRSERRKWLHLFDNVTAIIYLLAINEYDQVLEEDEHTNRMVESLRLYRSICHSAHFAHTTMILFLNKRDLFEEKIKRRSIKAVFSDYKGPQTYEDSLLYIEQVVVQLKPDKAVYVHRTCATDSDQMRRLLNSVTDVVVQKHVAMF